MPRLAKDYTKARVYKIMNSVDDKVYVGSCCSSLTKRFSSHKRDALQKQNKFYNHINEVGLDNCEIVLLERCENVRNEEELTVREQHWKTQFDKSLLLNSKDPMNQKIEQEDIQYITCERCGVKLRKEGVGGGTSLKRHQQSKACQKAWREKQEKQETASESSNTDLLQLVEALTRRVEQLEHRLNNI